MMIIYRPLLTNVMHEANAGYENMESLIDCRGEMETTYDRKIIGFRHRLFDQPQSLSNRHRLSGYFRREVSPDQVTRFLSKSD